MLNHFLIENKDHSNTQTAFRNSNIVMINKFYFIFLLISLKAKRYTHFYNLFYTISWNCCIHSKWSMPALKLHALLQVKRPLLN